MTDNDFWTLAMSKLDAFDDKALKEIIIDMADVIATQNANLSGLAMPQDEEIINCITDFTRLESVG